MSNSDSVTRYVLTDHARLEKNRRAIDEAEIEQVLSKPEQTEFVREGRKLFQSRVRVGKPPKEYLLRVVVDVDKEPPEVVTVYRTSKVKKYWRIDESPL